MGRRASTQSRCSRRWIHRRAAATPSCRRSARADADVFLDERPGVQERRDDRHVVMLEVAGPARTLERRSVQSSTPTGAAHSGSGRAPGPNVTGCRTPMRSRTSPPPPNHRQRAMRVRKPAIGCRSDVHSFPALADFVASFGRSPGRGARRASRCDLRNRKAPPASAAIKLAVIGRSWGSGGGIPVESAAEPSRPLVRLVQRREGVSTLQGAADGRSSVSCQVRQPLSRWSPPPNTSEIRRPTFTSASTAPVPQQNAACQLVPPGTPDAVRRSR